MDSGLLSQVTAYDPAFAAVLTARETYLHANKIVGQTNQQYTDALNAAAEAYLLWWEHDLRPAIANGYITQLAGYVTQMLMYPTAVPQLLAADHKPFALMDQGNFIGQFKAAVHSIYLDPTGPGGVLIGAWTTALLSQIENEPRELARYCQRYNAKTEAFGLMSNFEDLDFFEIPRAQVRDYIFTTLEWTPFLKGASGLHARGIYAYPADEDFELAVLDPVPVIDGPDPDVYAIQFITPGIIPFFVREAILDTLFAADDDTNTLSWEAGQAHFMTDTNQYFSKDFEAGSIVYTGQKIFVAYSFLLDELIVSTDPATAFQANQLICAIYNGGFELVVRNARQTIRGTDIIPRSMPPNRLDDGILGADVQIGSQGPTLIGSGNRIEVGPSGAPLAFIGKRAGYLGDAVGYYFRTGEGVLFDSVNGLGANTVGSDQIRPHSVKDYHLDFGSRTIQEEGITVSVDAQADMVSWSSGAVVWVDDLGNTITTEILAGNAFYVDAQVFVLWEPGEDHFTTTTDPDVAYADGQYIFLVYNGDANVTRNFAATIIDGNRIRTNSIDVNRLLSNSIVTQNIYLGGENFTLDGVAKRILVKDENGQNRAMFGQLSNDPFDIGLRMWDKDGNIVVSGGATVSYGRVDDQLSTIEDTLDSSTLALADLADDVNFVNGIVEQVGEDLNDMQTQIDNLLDNVGAIEGEALNAARVELELFRGFHHIGALGDLDFTPNADGDPGLIRIEGNYFDHPGIGKVQPSLPVEFRIPWIAHLAPPGKWFAVIWSAESVSTRFVTATGAGNFFPALLSNDVWRAYTSSSLIGETFTPRDTDLVCAIFSKKPELNGVDNVNSYIRETLVINARFDSMEAVVGDPSDPDNANGSIFARLSHYAIVIADETSARTTQYGLLESALGDATSTIETLEQTTADLDTAIALTSSTLGARLDTAESNITQNATAISDAVSSTASLGTSLRSEMAKINYDTFTKNPSFSNYTTTPGAPNDWTAQGTSTLSRQTGAFSLYGVRVVSGNNVSGGLFQQHTDIPAGKMRVEFATKLVSGAYTGGGVLVTKSDGTPLATYSFHNTADVKGDISTSKTGLRIFRPPVFDVTTTSNDGIVNVYLYGHNSVFGQSVAAANSVEFHQFSFRSIDAAGVEVANVSANLTTNYLTTTQVEGRITNATSALQTSLSSYVDQEVNSLSSTITSTYYTKTETDGVVSTAVGIITDDIQSIVNGAVGPIQSNLTLNYYTKTQTDGAVDSAVSAAQTSLRSDISRATGALTRNPQFSNFPVADAAPTDWTSSGTPLSFARIAGYYSAYGVRIASSVNLNAGITQQLTGIPNGKYNLEFATVLNNGTYVGAGIRLLKSDNSVIVSYPLNTTADLSGTVSASQTGLRYFKPTEFDLTTTSNNGIVNVQIWAHASALGSIANANAIDFHQIILRPITGEKNAINTINATLNTNYYTKTQTDGVVSTAVSGLQTTLNTRIDGEVSTINSNLTQNYSTTAQTNSLISSATSALDTSLRAYINTQDTAVTNGLQPQINTLTSNLNTNYSTTAQMNSAIAAAGSTLNTTLTGYIDGEIDTVNSALGGQINAVAADLAENYSTSVEVTDTVSAAINSLDSTLRSVITGTAGGINSNLSSNYYTKSVTDQNISVAVSNMQTSLRSEIGDSVPNLFTNGSFINFPTTPGLPVGWAQWVTPGTITRVPGKLSSYAVRIPGSAGVNGGITQQLTGLTTGKYTVNIASSLVSGNYNGAGLRFVRNSDNTLIVSYHLSAIADTNGDISSTKTGLRFFNPVEFSYTATDGVVDVYVAAHNSGLGSIAAANVVEFHNVELHAISLERADFNTLSASLTQNYYTKTQTDGAYQAADSALNTSLRSFVQGKVDDINGPSGLGGQITTINSTLNTDYYTKTATNEYVATAVSSMQTSLRSEIAGASIALTRNATFVNYAVTPGLPDQWTPFGTPVSTVRVAGRVSANALQITSSANVQAGVLQTLADVPNGKYSIEFACALNSGSYAGAGVALFDSASVLIAAFPAATLTDTNGEVSSSKAGVRYFRPTEFQINTPNNDGVVRVYAMAHHSSLGSIAAANSVIFHQVDLRPANSAQISASNVAANLTQNYSTTSQMTDAITTAKSQLTTQLQSYADGKAAGVTDALQPQINTINSTLTTNYSTTTSMNQAIGVAVSAAELGLRSDLAGSFSGVIRNPTFVNYPTTTGAPPDWILYGSPTVSRVAGNYSRYAARLDSNGGSVGGLIAQLTGIPDGKFTIEFAMALVSGTYTGSGIVVTNSAGTVLAAFAAATIADIAGVTSTNKTGVRYFRPAEFQITTLSGNGIVNVYAASHHASLGSISSANAVIFHQVEMAPISTTQSQVSTVSSSLQNNYSTTAQVNDKISTAITDYNLQIRGYVNDKDAEINSSLSLNYYTKSATDGKISEAITVAKSQMESFTTGITGPLRSDLETLYYTKTQTDGKVDTSVSAAQTTLRSEVAAKTESLTRNGVFSNYPDAVPVIAPVNWANFGSPVFTKIAGKFSSNGVRIASQNNGSAGISQQLVGVLSGKYTFEFATSLASGTYVASGILIQRASDGATIASYHIPSIADTNGDISNSKTGTRFFRPPPFDYTATDGLVNIYVMSHYSTFGSIAIANSIDWFQADLKPLSAAQKAASDIAADLSLNYYTKTETYTKAETGTVIGSAIAAFNLNLNTTFQGLSSDVDVNAQSISDINESAAFFNVKVAASGSTPAVVELQAGQNGSRISLQADEIYLGYDNTETGLADRKRGLAIVGGAVRVFGDLQADAGIFVGAAKFPVSLEPQEIFKGDGDVIQWAGGLDIGYSPKVQIDTTNLAPKAATESYDVKLLSLTSVGAVTYAKIITPSTPVTVTSTGDAAGGGGGNPTRVMVKSDPADASNGYYTFSVTGTMRIRSQRDFSGEIDGGEPGFTWYINSTSMQLYIYIHDGVAWRFVTAEALDTYDAGVPYFSSNSRTGTYAFTVSRTVYFADPIGNGGAYDFGVSSGSPITGDVVTTLNSVSYQKQGTGEVRSATPNGEKIKILFFPKNKS